MTLIGILLTSLVVAREWERGTMEALSINKSPSNTYCFRQIHSVFYFGNGVYGF